MHLLCIRAALRQAPCAIRARTRLAVLASAVLTVAANAQTPPPPLPSASALPDLPATEPAGPRLIPPELLPAPTLGAEAIRPVVPTVPELDASFAPKPLSPEMDNYRRHIEWRKLRNRVQNEPAVKQALRRAEIAPTDLEKRERLRDYYELLYAKMSAIASADMKPFLEQRKAETLGTLPQPRVRPETLRLTGAKPAPAASPKPQPN
jgi:hypothetical protein